MVPMATPLTNTAAKSSAATPSSRWRRRTGRRVIEKAAICRSAGWLALTSPCQIHAAPGMLDPPAHPKPAGKPSP